MSLHFDSDVARLRGANQAVWRRGRGAICVMVLLALVACQSGPAREVPAPDQKVVPGEPAGLTAQYERALTLLGAGDVDLAMKELEVLGSSYPEYSGPMLNLGIAYSKAGKLPEAEQAFKMAISRKPDSATAYNQLGILYRKLGRFIDAEKSYQRALEIQPDYALAHLNLGVLYDLYLQQPGRALQELEHYVDLTGESDTVVNGWIKEIKSRLGGAVRTTRSGA